MQLKKDVPKLEREISIKIQENQMKQHNVVDKNETPDIKKEKSLLPKKEHTKKTQGVKV